MLLGLLVGSGCALNVSFDSRAMLLDGHRKLLVGGAIHYPRSTPGMWPSMLQLAKENGLDVIESYIFWNGHEPVKGQYYFADQYDYVSFFREVQKAGMLVNARLGPYVCAEWNFGGFPSWLREVPGIEFRTNNKPFLDEMKTWIDYVVAMMKREKLFAWQGGPIIMVQIENEYGNVEIAYGAEGKKYVQWCGDYALSLDVGVPWIMCQQKDAPKGIINTCNGFYCDGFRPNQPSMPAMWTENWPGWFQKWGDSTPSRPAQDIAFAVARFFCRGGAYVNYYMWQGGSNFGRTVGGPLITTSYDYDVFLDEYGLVHNPKYSHLQQLHHLIHAYEGALVGQDEPKPISLGINLEAHVYNNTGGVVCFLSNIGKQDATVKFLTATYSLPAWSVSVLDECKTVVYNTALVGSIQSPPLMIPIPITNINTINTNASTNANANTNTNTASSHTPASAEETEGKGWGWEWWAEPIGAWGNTTRFNAPQEQLSQTHDLTDYLWYCTTVMLSTPKSVPIKVGKVEHVGHLFVNNKLLLTDQASLSTTANMVAGSNSVCILTVSMGLPNAGFFLEKTQIGVLGSVMVDSKDITNSSWTHQVGLQGEELKVWTEKGGEKVHWSQAPPTITPISWARTTFDVPPSVNGPLAIDLASMGKGSVYVNGRHLGRYWSERSEKMASRGKAGKKDNETEEREKIQERTNNVYQRFPTLPDAYGGSWNTDVDISLGCDACDYRGTFNPEKCRVGCGDYSQRWYHLPRDWTKPTGNVLVVVEEIGGDLTKVGLVERKRNVQCGWVGEHSEVDQEVGLLCTQGSSIASIDFASFGIPSGVCRALQVGSCHAANSTAIVTSLCKGKPACRVPASIKLFGDPCPRTTKHLSVQVTCI